MISVHQEMKHVEWNLCITCSSHEICARNS